MSGLPEGRIVKFVKTNTNSDSGRESKEYNFSQAFSALELMTGLRGVTSLEPYNGMLFDFGCRFRPAMTPKGLKFPIDIAFVTDNFEIVEFSRLDPEVGWVESSKRSDIRYVLEVPVGFFEENNIELNDTIVLV